MNKIIIDSINNHKNGYVDVILYIGSQKEIINMYFSENTRCHITIDRGDAVVMGILMFAIRHNMDICSRLPISETLYYKLINHFIPGICINKIYQPKIEADVIQDVSPIKDNGIIATGISCGVDSLYTIMEHTDKTTDGFKLNHLVFLDAGAHHFGSKEQWENLCNGRLDNARNFSKEVNLPLIEIKTNLPEILEKYSTYDHIEHHTYMMLSCILMIQSGVSRYYYSGGYPYGQFNCNLPSDRTLGCAHYDLFTLWCASNTSIGFYSTGGSLNRFEKVQALDGYQPAERHLNVCVTSVKNCGKCFKCKRTLLELDSAGIIDRYDGVFDIKSFNRNRIHLIKEGYRCAIKGDDLLKELMPYFHKNISKSERFIQKIRVLCGKAVSFLK